MPHSFIHEHSPTPGYSKLQVEHIMHGNFPSFLPLVVHVWPQNVLPAPCTPAAGHVPVTAAAGLAAATPAPAPARRSGTRVANLLTTWVRSGEGKSSILRVATGWRPIGCYRFTFCAVALRGGVHNSCKWTEQWMQQTVVRLTSHNLVTSDT